MKTSSVAVSTCAFPGKNVRQVDRLACRHHLRMEFSSGFRYEPRLEQKFLSSRCEKLIHNYFPPPQTPFVLNLASLNPSSWEKSIAHGRKGLRLAHRAKAPFYSIHAGFCFDPQPGELGHRLTHYSLKRPRRAYWQRFLKALSILLQDAQSLGVDLLVENNVVSRENASVPLLCADPSETQRLVKALSSRRLGLLLDTGHLKVSARTLGFKPDSFVAKLRSHIRAFHHSDNNGRTDSNRPLNSRYWFLPFMPQFSTAAHILEITHLSISEIKRHIHLLEQAMAAPGKRGTA